MKKVNLKKIHMYLAQHGIVKKRLSNKLYITLNLNKKFYESSSSQYVE